MTQCAAMDYGKYGITVNAYAPGSIQTQLREYRVSGLSTDFSESESPTQWTAPTN